MRPDEGTPSTRSNLLPRLAPLSWIALSALLALCLQPSPVALWPAGTSRILTFDDAPKGGRSRIQIDTTGAVLRFSPILDSGVPYPVAGAILYLGDSGKGVDLSRPGTLDLRLVSSNLEGLQICLVEDIPGFTIEDRWQTGRYDCQHLEIRPGTDLYRLSLEKFTTPEWWFPLSGLRPSQLGPESRKKVFRLILQTAEGTPLRQSNEAKFSTISVQFDRGTLWLWCLGTGLLLALAHAALLGRKPRPDATAPKPRLQFEPVAAVSYAEKEIRAVIDCVGREFSDADLTLEMISRKTGVPLDRVTTHIKTASGLLFKAYLNRIRCEAARKLLTETDLPVSEIAAKVGYGSVPHFNRIFREIHGTTPSLVRGGPVEESPEEAPAD